MCVCVCLCVRERESDLCALTLMRLRKSKYAPQLSELHGVNKNKVSVFMHLLPVDGEKCRLNKNKISGFKPLHTILLVIWWWEEQQASELQYVLSQTTDYNRCKGSVEILHKVCAITALVREIQSPAAVPLDTNPQTPAAQEWKGEHASGAEDKKKRTLSSCICCGGHTCKEHQVICCKSCWKDWTYTHTHTHTHTHTQFSH